MTEEELKFYEKNLANWVDTRPLIAEVRQRIAEVKRLRVALNKYGEHLGACQFDYSSGGCTCGLADEILKESK